MEEQEADAVIFAIKPGSGRKKTAGIEEQVWQELDTGKYRTNQQVADMLQRFLHIPDEQMPKKLDATDALGIAYCHFLQLGLPVNTAKGAKNWTTFAKQHGLADTAATTPNQKLLAALRGHK
jgi:Holliday junction resolvasome RuvABC endonuclease subunit